jgi:hypothetical protein
MNNNQPLTATKIYNQIYHEVLFITSSIFREQEPQQQNRCRTEDFYSDLYYFESKIVWLDQTVQNILYYFFKQGSMVIYLGVV